MKQHLKIYTNSQTYIILVVFAKHIEVENRVKLAVLYICVCANEIYLQIKYDVNQ